MIGIEDLSTSISIIKDPFSGDCMTNFRVWCSKGYDGSWSYHGNIEFQNGQTEGKQSFKGESLSDVLRKMEVFITEELGIKSK